MLLQPVPQSRCEALLPSHFLHCPTSITIGHVRALLDARLKAMDSSIGALTVAVQNNLKVRCSGN